MRIMNTQRPQGQSQHTRHGVRLTAEQVRELIPRLVDFISEYDDEQEQKERQPEKNVA